MLEAIAKNWWALLIRGIAAIMFGIVAFMWPGITLTALVLLFGMYALIDGLSAIRFGAASYQRSESSWWEMMLVGVLGVFVAIITFLWPGITAMALLVVIGIWAIVRGIMEIAAAIRLRKVLTHEWLLALAGVLSIVAGIIILARPQLGALAIVWLIGFWAILVGIIATILAFRLLGIKHRLEKLPTIPTM